MHRVSTLNSQLKEYSYIGIDKTVSKFYLTVFSGNKIFLLSKGNENIMDPCEFCWYEWELCPEETFTTTKDSTAINNVSVPHDPPPHCWIEHCETECMPGGGGGNGGGGGGGGCPTCPPPPQCDDPLWYSFVPEENPCDPPPPPPIPIDSCETAHLMAQKMDSLYINGKVDSMLNTMPGWQNLTVEKGYSIFKDCRKVNGDTVVIRYICNNIQSGTDSSLIITDYTTEYSNHFELWAGWLHTHPPKTYPCPSPPDIYNLIEAAYTPKFDGNIIAAANGNKYAITVTNTAAANAFFNTRSQFLNGINWNENSTIGKAFKDAYDYFKDKVYKNNPDKINLAYEKALAVVLNSFNSGITLHKKNPLSGNFKPIVVKTITPNPNKPHKKMYVQDCL